MARSHTSLTKEANGCNLWYSSAGLHFWAGAFLAFLSSLTSAAAEQCVGAAGRWLLPLLAASQSKYVQIQVYVCGTELCTLLGSAHVVMACFVSTGEHPAFVLQKKYAFIGARIPALKIPRNLISVSCTPVGHDASD